MPELPEVETVKRGLKRLIVGQSIATVISDNPKSFPNSKQDIDSFLIGSEVLDVRRRAKVLMIDLSTKYSLVIHLKMTGQLVFINKNTEDGISNMEYGELPIANSQIPIAKTSEVRFSAGHPSDSLVNNLPDKSTRVTIDFTDGSHLFFNDQRKFGWMRLMPTAEIVNLPFMQKVGPEPLEADFTPEQFAERFKRRAKTSIKAAILDQSVIAGVGNIYADESLWAAKIHPLTKVANVPSTKYHLLYTELRSIMNLSIEKGGSTNRNYVDAEGKKGSYMDFANVFRREGQACPRCGDIIIKFKAAGRGTHICPSCQAL